MVVIRLSRGGSKKRPFYKIVAADKRNKRDGYYLERLGFFNPLANEQGDNTRLELNKERLDYWVGTGAQMSDRVASLVKEYAKSKA
jgi:small subunit ribosomal protein S16